MTDDHTSSADNILATGEDQFASDLYRKWFLEYASYVILDRAIPSAEDGLKPVQRRLLHALSEMDDGRFNKAANVIGHTMRYHPHGDMAISDALVKLTQKGLLIEPQGNWGNPITGDQAAASRYIEARLTEFAKNVVFNANITDTVDSYDGRYKEPVSLPIKFPLLTFLGAEGIAVGLATKILPHNFCELIQESIAVLKGHTPNLLPDFPGGGIGDFSEYRDGQKGGRIKVRARITSRDSKSLCISEIPFGSTTSSLIDSIIAANDKGKIKIKKIEDNTAKAVEIIVHLANGTTPEQVVAGLYAFTDCELSIAPNCCVIKDKRPFFCKVTDLLYDSTQRTKSLLNKELEFERLTLIEKLHFTTIERIFVAERIYRKIEKAQSLEEIVNTTQKALSKFKESMVRPMQDSDIPKLLDMRIKRISRYDLGQTDKLIAKLKARMRELDHHLANLTAYTIAYYQGLLQKFGQQFPRRTQVASFAKVKATKAALANRKIYIDPKEGFVGSNLKTAELLGEASEYSEVLTLTAKGQIMAHRANDKVFVGKDVIHAEIYTPSERCVFHLIYRDGATGAAFAKRFTFTSYTRGRSYDLTRGSEGSKVLYFSVNPNGEQEGVRIVFDNSSQLLKTPSLDFDFAKVPCKSRRLVGELISKTAIVRITRCTQGSSTLEAERIWFDRDKKRLNKSGVGRYLGKFTGKEQLIIIYKTGTLEKRPVNCDDLFSDDLVDIRFKSTDMILTAVYYHGLRKQTYVKRVAIDALSSGRQPFVPADSDAKLLLATFEADPEVEAQFFPTKRSKINQLRMKLSDIVGVKGIAALGNRLHERRLRALRLLVGQSKS